jgi:hypothetical protein
MSDENALREKAREALEKRKWPNRPPDNVWGGPGTGARCDVCETSIPQGETELEIEFAQGDPPGPRNYYVHARCFSALEVERQQRGNERA